MKKELAVISSPEFGEIRSVMVNGEPLFVAKDVCDVLGISNSRDAMNRLDEDEKAMSVLPTQFGKKSMNMVNESGLYNLIFQSRKPEARAFRKWVTQEVLPNIRKYGFYMTPEKAMDVSTEKKLRKQMLAEMEKYLIDEDLRKCARRFGTSELTIQSVVKGQYVNNDMMADLQQRAIANREKWFDAYGQGRMLEVLGILTGKK